jgi:hypothetical protein
MRCYWRLRSMRLCGMSFARPIPPSATHCWPSRINAIEAPLRTSALSRLCTNSKGAVDLLQPAISGSETVQPVPRSRPILRALGRRQLGWMGLASGRRAPTPHLARNNNWENSSATGSILEQPALERVPLPLHSHSELEGIAPRLLSSTAWSRAHRIGVFQ